MSLYREQSREIDMMGELVLRVKGTCYHDAHRVRVRRYPRVAEFGVRTPIAFDDPRPESETAYVAEIEYAGLPIEDGAANATVEGALTALLAAHGPKPRR